MSTLAHSVATTPDGVICESCLDAAPAALPVRRLLVRKGVSPTCEYCGDPAKPDFGHILPEDLNY